MVRVTEVRKPRTQTGTRWAQLEVEALRLATETATSAFRPNCFKVSLHDLARSVGIHRVEERDITATALLVPGPDGHHTVLVRKGDPFSRQRWSLAHEVAHLLLEPLLGDSGHSWTRLAPSQDYQSRRVERLCDAMAAEILMPGKVFGEWIAKHQWTAMALPEASRDFSVSLEAASRRFMALCPEKAALVRWKLSDNESFSVTKPPVAPRIKEFRYIEFATDRNRPSPMTIETYKSGASTESFERVKLYIGRSIQTCRCLVESLSHGNGQWREVYSFVYPARLSAAGWEGIKT